jgi:uncharacterized membrane protein
LLASIPVPDQAVEEIRIKAPPERCFGVAVDFERYPSWASDVKAVEVLDRDDEGRGRLVRYEVAALGRRISYVLDYDYAEAPRQFTWRLAKADILRGLDGVYRFDPDGEGTIVTYRLAVDLAIPLPGFVKRQAAGRIANSATRQLKARVESEH